MLHVYIYIYIYIYLFIFNFHFYTFQTCVQTLANEIDSYLGVDTLIFNNRCVRKSILENMLFVFSLQISQYARCCSPSDGKVEKINLKYSSKKQSISLNLNYSVNENNNIQQVKLFKIYNIQ